MEGEGTNAKISVVVRLRASVYNYNVITILRGIYFMQTKIVQIGNSRGIRIPKSFIEEAGLGGEVELRVVESGILIERIYAPRAGWRKAARELRERGEDGLLDEPTPSDFDVSEWEWE